MRQAALSSLAWRGGRVEFRVVGPGDEAALADMFAQVDTTFFRPHRFTRGKAVDIAHRRGRDLFALLIDGDVPVAYGMLRGWDEGYAIPSLGIAVRNGLHGRGIGRRMMRELHRAAAERGATSVRLRVHPDNLRARRLYEGLGYAYAGEERGELVMLLALEPAAAPGVRLLRPEDPVWDATIAKARASVFHSAGYHRYTAGFGQGAPYLAVIGDEECGVAWPYLLRALDDVPSLAGSARMDVTSVYGYPGPLVWGCRSDDERVRLAFDLIAETWRLQGVVSAFTRFNPLLANAQMLPPTPAWATAGSPGVIQSGSTVSVDLTQTPEEIRAEYGRDLGREIRRGRNAGLETVVDVGWEHLPDFAEQYRETMLRLGAADFYFFSQADFERLHQCLPDSAHLLVARLGGIVAAAGLFLDSGECLEWHLVSAKAELQSLSPSKVLVEDAILWAKSRGFRAMHLGGGRGAHADSLLWFKSRFSQRRHQFAVGAWVVDPDYYGHLVRERVASLPVGATLDPSYFPAYRAEPILGAD